MGMERGAGKEDIMGKGGILRNMGGNMGGLGLGETLGGIGREREEGDRKQGEAVAGSRCTGRARVINKKSFFLEKLHDMKSTTYEIIKRSIPTSTYTHSACLSIAYKRGELSSPQHLGTQRL